MASKQANSIKQKIALPQAEIEKWFTEIRDISEQFIDANSDLAEIFVRMPLNYYPTFSQERRPDSIADPVNYLKNSDPNHRDIIYFRAFAFGVLRWAVAEPSPKLCEWTNQYKKALYNITIEHEDLLKRINGQCTSKGLIQSVYFLELLDYEL